MFGHISKIPRLIQQLLLGVSGPCDRAFAESLTVAVAELQLDVLAIGLDRLTAQGQLLCNPARAETGSYQAKDVQFTVGNSPNAVVWVVTPLYWQLGAQPATIAEVNFAF